MYKWGLTNRCNKMYEMSLSLHTARELLFLIHFQEQFLYLLACYVLCLPCPDRLILKQETLVMTLRTTAQNQSYCLYLRFNCICYFPYFPLTVMLKISSILFGNRDCEYSIDKCQQRASPDKSDNALHIKKLKGKKLIKIGRNLNTLFSALSVPKHTQ